MADFGGMVSFLAASAEEAAALVARTQIWKLAESLGGVESLIEVPAQMTHASTADAPFAAPREPRPPLGRDRVGRRPGRRPRDRARPLCRARLAPCTQPIDLHHQSRARHRRATWSRPTTDLRSHDCGPATCIAALKAGLAERGLELTDVRHLLLSHIHLDHAGAAGTLVREHPGLQVHVSEIGAPHVVDPSRLEASARRLYADFDDLWGELAPVPEENVHVVGDRVLGLECFPSPGHASHHVCYLHDDGTLYAGDAAGVRIVPAPHVLPVSPPPDVDVEGWFRTFEEIERRGPERLALIHFGVADSPSEHLALAREELDEVERARPSRARREASGSRRRERELDGAVGADEADDLGAGRAALAVLRRAEAVLGQAPRARRRGLDQRDRLLLAASR